MSAAPAGTKPKRVRFPGVRAPKPLLSPEAESRLSARQLELLEQLDGQVAAERLASMTMAEIAAEANCSLRTLYGISPSKDELVLTVVDRRLHRIGRAAIESLDATQPPLEILRAYLRAANEAVQPEAVFLAHHLTEIPGAKRLLDAHEDYVMAVTRSLLDRAIARDEIEPVDTASLAHVLGGLGREFGRREMAELLSRPAKETADGIADIILRGLERR